MCLTDKKKVKQVLIVLFILCDATYMHECLKK